VSLSFNAEAQRRKGAKIRVFSSASLRLCVFAFLFMALSVAAQQAHFAAYDIYVDSKNVPLAAYQLEFSSVAEQVKITGIEGGEHEAFKQPPFYDPKAIQQERVILAAFNTESASKLPTGKTRVATVHVQFKGPQPPSFSLKLQTAADPEGKSISTKASFNQRGYE
jgi:hypothetical protein